MRRHYFEEGACRFCGCDDHDAAADRSCTVEREPVSYSTVSAGHVHVWSNKGPRDFIENVWRCRCGEVKPDERMPASMLGHIAVIEGRLSGELP